MIMKWFIAVFLLFIAPAMVLTEEITLSEGLADTTAGTKNLFDKKYNGYGTYGVCLSFGGHTICIGT